MMLSSRSSNSVAELAGRIRADIKNRALNPGDQYLNSVDAARHFQVSTLSANRALQLLAKRRIVTRKQRLGTVITLAEDTASREAGIDRVHLLVYEDYFESEGVLADGVVMGIQGVMPRVGIQFNFLPQNEERPYVEELVSKVLKTDVHEAFVLVHASLMTQRVVAQSGCPAVVYGTPYPSVEPLCSIDHDHALEAELLVDYLVRRCRSDRLLLMMRERLHTGDHLFLDAIHQEASKVGLRHDRLTLRCMPQDADLVKAELNSVLQVNPKASTGVICANQFLANIAERTIEAEPSERSTYQVALMACYRRPERDDSSVPYLHSCITPEQIGADIANLLVRQVRGERISIGATYPLELRGA